MSEIGEHDPNGVKRQQPGYITHIGTICLKVRGGGREDAGIRTQFQVFRLTVQATS